MTNFDLFYDYVNGKYIFQINASNSCIEKFKFDTEIEMFNKYKEVIENGNIDNVLLLIDGFLNNTNDEENPFAFILSYLTCCRKLLNEQFKFIMSPLSNIMLDAVDFFHFLKKIKDSSGENPFIFIFKNEESPTNRMVRYCFDLISNIPEKYIIELIEISSLNEVFDFNNVLYVAGVNQFEDSVDIVKLFNSINSLKFEYVEKEEKIPEKLELICSLI